MTTHDEPMPEGEETPPPGVHAMGVLRWLLVALMAAAAVAAIGYYAGWFEGGGEGSAAQQYYCPMHPGVVQDHPGQCPICSMTLVQKPPDTGAAHAQGESQATGQYYCPMHPEVTSTDPNATCDKCNGMKLVPKPAEAPVAPSAAASVPGLVPIQLTADRIQLTGMRTAPVKREVLAPQLRTIATVTAREQGQAVIQIRFAGWIEKLLVEQTGQRVRKGQVLATIYSQEVLAVQQEYLNALRWAAPGGMQATGTAAPSSYKEDARRRLELLGISNTEIDEIERSGQPMRAIQIRSPVNGYVTQKVAVQGLYVQPGTALFEVADLSTVWALADVYQHEVARVREGQRAEMELEAFPGERFPGKVTFIHPTIDPATRTMRIRMELPNRDLRLKPGMYGTISLQLEGAEVLVVPREALVDTGTLQYVFVAKEGGHFEPRRVTPGTRTQDKVEILTGVREGEIVVTTANFLIDSESRLRATIEGVSNLPEAPATPQAPASTEDANTPQASPRADDAAEPKPSAAPKRQPAAKGGVCETQFDQAAHRDKYQQCRACAVHRGMGSMEQDCIQAIAKPWK